MGWWAGQCFWPWKQQTFIGNCNPAVSVLFKQVFERPTEMKWLWYEASLIFSNVWFVLVIMKTPPPKQNKKRNVMQNHNKQAINKLCQQQHKLKAGSWGCLKNEDLPLVIAINPLSIVLDWFHCLTGSTASQVPSMPTKIFPITTFISMTGWADDEESHFATKMVIWRNHFFLNHQDVDTKNSLFLNYQDGNRKNSHYCHQNGDIKETGASRCTAQC